jgi:hypothetical protein
MLLKAVTEIRDGNKIILLENNKEDVWCIYNFYIKKMVHCEANDKYCKNKKKHEHKL